MRFVSFASSSRGNCSLISYKDTNILVDCGISRKRIIENLAKYGMTISDIDAILITHEHDDHISGLPSILKNDRIKIASQKDTLLKIVSYCEGKGTKVNTDDFKILYPKNADDKENFISIKDIKVFPIKSSHDVPSVFYKMILGDKNIAIVTDLGIYDDYIVRSISDIDYLMLECNYDVDMMLDSIKYPAFLKSRIMGDRGHLSNVQCSELIMKINSDRLKKVFLSHISDETNSEEYAYEFVVKYLKDKCDKKVSDKINVTNRLVKTIIYEGA